MYMHICPTDIFTHDTRVIKLISTSHMSTTVIFFSQFESMPFGHSSAIFALGSRLHSLIFKDFNPQKFNL